MIDPFKPYKIGNLELKNRFVRSATWDVTADENGAVTDNSIALFEELAKGDIGLIITGFAFVSLLGQATPGQYGAHTDEMIPGLIRLVKATHREGSKIALQIVHSGVNSINRRRQEELVQVVSNNNYADKNYHEMTESDIQEIIDDFASAAERAVEAGFDAVQLHGAHGYLMSQFLSPLSNQRNDLWGGSNENRRRFHIEVIKKIRQTIGKDFPLMIKFGAQENREGGLSLEEGIETAKLMVENGIDAIEVSAGDGRSSVPIMRNEPEKVLFRNEASEIKKEVAIPVILVGGIRTLQTAKDILDNGDADMISMCRPFIREPELLLRWQKGDTASAKCISCSRCLRGGKPIACNEEIIAASEKNN